MNELIAELKECTCIAQGREALAEQIIEKHVAKLFLAGEPTAADLDAHAEEQKVADATA